MPWASIEVCGTWPHPPSGASDSFCGPWNARHLDMDASTRRQEVNSSDADGAMTDGRAMVPCPAADSERFFLLFILCHSFS